MNDSLYNFNDKSDIEDQSLKLNMDELFAKKQQQDLNLLNNYNKILVRIHNKIKYVSRQLINEQCCWYVMPEMMIGIPKYDYKDCTAYVMEKLRENGFVVRYTHPNLLFISWKQWVPGYVRSEIKKKTGNDVDEYGNIVDKNITIRANLIICPQPIDIDYREGCKYLSGPKYAPISSKYVLKNKIKKINNKILISFGAYDSKGLTLNTIKAIKYK